MYTLFNNEQDDDSGGGSGDHDDDDDDDDNVIAERSYCNQKCNIGRCCNKSYRIGDWQSF